MLWDGVGIGLWLGGVGARGGIRHTHHKPISIITNNKFIRPSAISTLGDFSLSQNEQPILAQSNFHNLYKSGQCSPKHKLFSDFWCHMIDETFSHPYMYKISEICFTLFIWQTIQKCQLFFETPGSTLQSSQITHSF